MGRLARKPSRRYTAPLSADLSAATPAAVLAPPAAAETRAIVDSIYVAIGSDDRMWNFESTVPMSWRSAAICRPRGARPAAMTTAGCAVLPDCNWGQWIVNAPCNNRVFAEQIFQYPRFFWAQAKLRSHLASKPGGYPTAGDADRWARWVYDLYSYLSVGYWATNVRATPHPGAHQLFGGGEIAARPYLNTDGRAQRDLRYLFDGIRSSRYPAITEPVRSPVSLKLWNLLGVEGVWVYPYTRQTTPSKPSGRASFGPLMTTATGASPTGMQPDWPLGQAGSVRLSLPPPGAAPLAVLTHYMRESARVAERENFHLVGELWTRGGTRVVPTLWLSAEGIVRVAEAQAQDFVNTTFGDILVGGLRRWNDLIAMLPFDYRAGLFGGASTYEQFSRSLDASVINATMSSIQTGLAVIGSIATLANPAAGVMVAVAGMLIQGVGQIISAADAWATGSGAAMPCPPVPVVRGSPVAECTFDIREERVRDIDPDYVPPGPPPSPPPPPPPEPPELPPTPSTPTSGGVAPLVAGASLIALLLAARR